MPDVLKSAYNSGLINSDSSSTVPLYQISRYWRELFQKATRHRSDELHMWSEKEVLAGKIITSTLLFLGMEGCANVEQLIIDTVNTDTKNYEQ